MKRILAVALLCAAALPAPAGPLDWLSSKFHKQIPGGIAEARLRTYLKTVVENPELKVTHGRSELSAAEKKRLDPKILERIASVSDVVIADLVGPTGSGIIMLASKDIGKPEWDPATEFLGYLVMASDAVFPADADRAQALCGHLIGDPALHNLSPEAGPVWQKKEAPGGGGRGGGGGGRGGGGGGMGGRGGRFSGAESFAGEDGYQAKAGEVSPDEDEIPAWVARGTATIPLGQNRKPTKVGLLIALVRGAGNHGVQVIHVVGSGAVGKPIFRGLNDPVVIKKTRLGPKEETQ